MLFLWKDVGRIDPPPWSNMQFFIEILPLLHIVEMGERALLQIVRMEEGGGMLPGMYITRDLTIEKIPAHER
jgi:hypothetical protein